MEIYKEGFLSKAGKRSWEGYRKRWFVLNSDDLKYYNPEGGVYDDSSRLGTIGMSEVQSVTPSKSVKYGFEITTKSRTFSLSAKSDVDRNDWIARLNKAWQSKRSSGGAVNQEALYEAPKNQSNSLDSDVSKKNKGRDKSKKNKKTSKSSFFGSPNSQKTGNDKTDSEIKQRSQTVNIENETTGKEENDLKKRSLTLNDVTDEKSFRPTSMLRKMSTEVIDDDFEEFYKELDDELNKVSSDEEDSVEDSSISESSFVALTPKGNESDFAFNEIKKLFSEEFDEENDFEKLKTSVGINIDENFEYPNFQLLKSYLQKVLDE